MPDLTELKSFDSTVSVISAHAANAAASAYVALGVLLRPLVNDGAGLGDAAFGWSDLDLAAGGELGVNSVKVLDTVGGLSTPTAIVTATAAVENAINTAKKRAGKMVFDTTYNRLMIATGSAAADTWRSADGATTVTPA